MTNQLNTSPDSETKNIEKSEPSKQRTKRTLLMMSMVLILVLLAGAYYLMNNSNSSENTKDEEYRFVNNNSVICAQNIQVYQIDCEDLTTGQKRSIDIPDQFKNAGIKSSHDGTKLLLEQSVDAEKTTYVVTDTNFTNPQSVTIPYEEENGRGNPYPNVMWGNNANTLIISKQVKEENDADFLSAPLVVWTYDVTTKQSRRIFKTGEVDVQALKPIGASDEYLFISQPIVKNWVAQNTDPPADALLAVRLDDGFVRTVSIENIVKIKDVNKYAAGIFISYDPVLSTFYFSGQKQTSNDEFENFYAAASLIENDGLSVKELSRLTSKASYYGVTTSKGTMIADWSNESENFNYSFVARADEIYNTQIVNPDKDSPKFSIATLPVAE